MSEGSVKSKTLFMVHVARNIKVNNLLIKNFETNYFEKKINFFTKN